MEGIASLPDSDGKKNLYVEGVIKVRNCRVYIAHRPPSCKNLYTLPTSNPFPSCAPSSSSNKVHISTIQQRNHSPNTTYPI